MKKQMLLTLIVLSSILVGCSSQSDENSSNIVQEMEITLVNGSNITEGLYSGEVSDDKLPNGKGQLWVNSEEVYINIDGDFKDGSFIDGVIDYSVKTNNKTATITEKGIFDEKGLSGDGYSQLDVENGYSIKEIGDFEFGKLNGTGNRYYYDGKQLFIGEESGFFKKGELN